ncbi:unnamed protein product [Trichogramma brassicae]|uniref:Protein ECT2 n=1 Tax=Trichogramma brassicae TaxID=86971 RepID=A0A6H5ILL4_9HYME|nr:unnamed protein product [Trichogramma brassicae]
MIERAHVYQKRKWVILGPTALLQLAQKKEPLPSNNRPMYTRSMFGTAIVFTGFREKEELTKLIKTIHFMGGSVKRDMGTKTTHLIAKTCGGEKCRYADTFRVPILKPGFIEELWADRDNLDSHYDQEELIVKYQMLPFTGARICFHGFTADETKHMGDMLKQYGGQVVDLTDSNVTHVVVDETQKKMPDVISERACVVKSEWFWTSIQNLVVADERDYLFANHLEITKSTPLVNREIPTPDTGTPSSASKRKRKRLAETLNYNNGQASPTPTSVNKRRSSLSDVLSLNGSYLDRTVSPDKKYLDEVESSNTDAVIKNLSPRHQVFLELLQTESNYVGILSTIMTMFKSPLESLIDSKNELLNGTEAKIIFGNFPPIYEVHKNMLDELRHCANRWTEDTCIGTIFLKYVPDLIKAYPPYVNFFENTKEMLDQCDQNKPRFHAFLKVCQTKPDCGRQSLKELLIKPVQRLPSISLLLNGIFSIFTITFSSFICKFHNRHIFSDILKHTSKSNPDHGALEKSLNSIKEVMTYINEDKRKTEGQLAMFDIFNEIDNCPPHLVSSHRSFIGKCDVTEVHEELSRRGDHLVLFLFTDTLEICKKRSKGIEKMKSPNSTVHSGFHTVKVDKGKPYKHIRMLPLSAIKRVVDIRETDDCRKVFALMVRNNQELKDKFYTFALLDEEVDKTKYLKSLCRQMANTICKADSDSFLIELDFNQLEGSNSEVSVGTLSKAFKFATRTRMKVGRAFSFNKTPNKLKRAMSTMMSPFGSTTSLTPASRQLAQMRLASCNNLNELGSSTQSTRDDLLVAPMSVQPTRKAKCNTLSVAAIRRC